MLSINYINIAIYIYKVHIWVIIRLVITEYAGSIKLNTDKTTQSHQFIISTG